MNIYVKTDSEDYHFYTDGGLFYTRKNGKKSLLFENCLNEFDVCSGKGINVVCQNDEGDILKFTKAGNEWIKSIILKSKNRNAAAFGMRIIETEDDLHFIYGLKHGDDMLIVHQLLPDGKPQVITKAYSEKFFVRLDETGCIYVICDISSKLWHFFTYRSGGWSASEELCENCEIEDILCTGYKQFCMVKNMDGELIFENGDENFAISGSKPSIAKTDREYIVFSENNGGIVYTSKEKATVIISCGSFISFHVRLPFGGEYRICETCPGSIRQNKPRLFVIGNPSLEKMTFGEKTRIEFTKQTIALESKISKLEKRVEKLESNLCNPQ